MKKPTQQKARAGSARPVATPDRTARPAGVPKTDLLILATILLIGAALRAAFMAETSTTPEFRFPPVDCGYHNYWATAIVTGNWDALPEDAMGRDPEIRSHPYFRPPGYPWFLSLLYRVAGCNTITARSLQMALGLLNVVLMFLLARSTLGRLPALVAAAFMSTYWLFIYFEAQLEEPVLLIFLSLVLMLICRRFADRARTGMSLAAGVLVGLFALARPNILLFAPVLMIWIFHSARKGGARFSRGALLALVCAAGVALPVLPVTIRNRVAAHDSVLISANGGVNLYIGNNGFSAGKFIDDIPDLGHFRTCFDYPTIVANLEGRLGRPLKYSEVSRFYARKATDFIRANPLAAFKLTLRKALLFWAPGEITHNNAVDVDHRFSKVLRLLPGNFPFVLSLALAGAFVLARRARTELQPASARTVVLMALFVLVYYVSFVPFFITSLYRVPITPFLIFAAAYAVSRMAGLLERRAFAPAAGLAGAWLALFTALSIPLLLVSDRDKALNIARWHFAKGVTYTMTGKPDMAISHYQEAIRVDPQHARAHNNLAGLLLRQSDTAGAVSHYQAALQFNAGFEEALAGMGQALAAQGKWAEASASFERALQVNPRMVDARFALANTLAQAGSFDEAVSTYRQVLRERPNMADAHSNLGVVLASQNKIPEAVAEYEEALRLSPNNATTYANLGIAMETAGDAGRAANYYRLALQLDPGNTGVRQRLAALSITTPGK